MRDANTSVSNTSTADPSVFLRMKAVTKMTGLGRSTIYRLVAQDKFPSPVKLADRAVAWLPRRPRTLERRAAQRALIAIHPAHWRSTPRASASEAQLASHRHRELQHRAHQEQGGHHSAPAPGREPVALVDP